MVVILLDHLLKVFGVVLQLLIVLVHILSICVRGLLVLLSQQILGLGVVLQNLIVLVLEVFAVLLQLLDGVFVVLLKKLLVTVTLQKRHVDAGFSLNVFINDRVAQKLLLVVSDFLGFAAFLTVLVVGILLGGTELLQVLDLALQ